MIEPKKPHREYYHKGWYVVVKERDGKFTARQTASTGEIEGELQVIVHRGHNIREAVRLARALNGNDPDTPDDEAEFRRKTVIEEAFIKPK